MLRWTTLIVLAIGTLQILPSQAADPSPLVFVNAATDGYKLTRPGRDFKERFEIFPSDGVELSVHLAIPELQAPNTNAESVKLKLDGQDIGNPADIKIRPKGVTLTLSAALPAAAIYVSSIQVTVAGKKPIIVPLQITRSRVPTAIEVKDLNPVSGVTGSPVEVLFTLRETSGQQTILQAVDFANLGLGPPAKRIQKSLAQPPVVKVQEKGDWGLPDQKTLTFEPGGSKKFMVTLAGLDEAGDYGGTIRVSSQDGAANEQAVSMMMHDPYGYCIFWIVFGVVLSFLLRWYLQTKRPQLVRSDTALQLIDYFDQLRAQPQLNEDTLRILEMYRRRAEGAYERIQQGDGSTADAVLIDLKGKLDLLSAWIAASRNLESMGASPYARDVRKTINSVWSVLVAPASTTVEIDDALKLLNAIPNSINAAMLNDFKSAHDDFQAVINKSLNGSAHTSDVRMAMERIRQAVTEASGLANSNKVEEACTKILRARQEYVRIVTDELEASLNAVPLGYEAPAWQAKAVEIKAVLDTARNDPDPARALAAYEEARRQYLKSMLKGLSEEKGTLTASINAAKTNNPADPNFDALSSKLVEADSFLVKATGEMATALDDAFENTRSADELIRIVRTKVDALGIRMDSITQSIAEFFLASAAPPLTSIGLPAAIASLPASPAKLREDVLRSLTVMDFVTSAIVAIAAVLLGMKIFWLGNLTWGGPSDYATALLWGLGLHQFSFDGVNSLVQRFNSGSK